MLLGIVAMDNSLRNPADSQSGLTAQAAADAITFIRGTGNRPIS